MTVVGLPTVSTRDVLGSRWVKGPKSSPCSFIARKFSPLIQIKSIEPPVCRPAAFSATTRATASEVSVIFTCFSSMPCSARTRCPTQAMKALVFSSPAQALK